jgi:hypothetical protein
MSKEFKDKRLPKGFTVYLNAFDEYVVCDASGRVAQVDNRNNNIRASRTLNGAVEHYLAKRKSEGLVE